MELNEALRLNDEQMFCEEGNRIALEVIESTHQAISGADGIMSLAEAEKSILVPLRLLYFHRANCADCGEE